MRFEPRIGSRLWLALPLLLLAGTGVGAPAGAALLHQESQDPGTEG